MPELIIQRAKSAGQKAFEKTDPKLKRQYYSSLSAKNKNQYNSIGSNKRINSRELSKKSTVNNNTSALYKNIHHNASTNTEILKSIESFKNNLFNDKRYSIPVDQVNTKYIHFKPDNTSQKTIKTNLQLYN